MPTREVHEREICGHVYRVTLLGAKEGTQMALKLEKMIGPTTASFLEGTVITKAGGMGSIAVGAAEALREISALLKADECMPMLEQLAKHTVVVLSDELEPRLWDMFDDHFSGHYDALVGWARFALEVNFRSFFGGADGLRELFSKVKTLIASQSLSPKTSTGSSTESPAANATPQA